MATTKFVAPIGPQELEKLGPPKWTVIESFLLGVRVECMSGGCMCLLGLPSRLYSLVLSMYMSQAKKKLTKP